MIRPAQIEDLPVLMQMGAAMHKESNFAPIPYDAHAAAEFIADLIGSDEGFVYVADHGGTITGFMFAMSYPVWFGDGFDRIASDLVLYVDPQWRHGTTAVFLVTAFKQWAINAGVRQIRAGTAAGAAGQAANPIYLHLGFAPAGQVFVFDVGGQHAMGKFNPLEAATADGSQ